MTTALYYDDLFLRHDTGQHPENARRLSCTVDHLRETGLWDRCLRPEAHDADADSVALVHERAYVDAVLQMAEQGGGSLDADTRVSPDSGRAALRAAGAALDACDKVLAGEARSALCLVRPPGHHARPSAGMGFCLFNNVAIAAKHLVQQRQLSRVAIVDWDAHHGNGTQEAFWTDPRVLYVSLHLWPFYPGTGGHGESGEGKGAGTTVNIPLSYGVTSEEFLERFDQTACPLVAAFEPEFILISAGFDSHAGDPLAGAGLEIEDYRRLTDALTAIAAERCNGRVVSVLEGGYDLTTLPRCVAAHLEGLLAATSTGTQRTGS